MQVLVKTPDVKKIIFVFEERRDGTVWEKRKAYYMERVPYFITQLKTELAMYKVDLR